MKPMKIIGSLWLLVVLLSCKSQLNPSQLAERDQLLEQIAEKVIHGDHQIVLTVAHPFNTTAVQQVLNSISLPAGNTSTRIDIRDRADYIVLSAENVMAKMSFYGEVRMSSGYGSEAAGIQFNAAPLNYTAVIDKDKATVVIEYTVSHSTESYDVNIEIFSDGNTVVHVSSSHRTSMRYNGILKPYLTDER